MPGMVFVRDEGTLVPEASFHQKYLLISRTFWEAASRYGQTFAITEFGQPFEEILFVEFVLEDPLSLNAPGHYMVKGARRIEVWLSRHASRLSKNLPPIKMFLHRRSPFPEKAVFRFEGEGNSSREVSSLDSCLSAVR
jgi:hypothetical protein